MSISSGGVLFGCSTISGGEESALLSLELVDGPGEGLEADTGAVLDLNILEVGINEAFWLFLFLEISSWLILNDFNYSQPLQSTSPQMFDRSCKHMPARISRWSMRRRKQRSRSSSWMIGEQGGQRRREEDSLSAGCLADHHL